MRKALFSISFGILSFVLIFVATVFLVSTNFSNSIVENENYRYESAKIDMVVNEDNSFLITEELRVSYDAGSFMHGIIRSIPKNALVKGYKYGLSISDFEVLTGNYSSIVHTASELQVKFGNENIFVDGNTMTYKYSYNVDIGYDRSDIDDVFYWNLWGTDFDAKLKKLEFSIDFPTSIGNVENIKFYAGSLGSSEQLLHSDLNLNYNTTTNVLTGMYDEDLPFENGFTIKVDLPNGYYSLATDPNVIDSITPYFVIGLLILAFVLISVLVSKSKSHLIVKTVEVSPPDDIDPCAFVQTLFADIRYKDLSSLILYWANQGYIKIHIDDQQNVFAEKIKNIKTESSYQKDVFKALFKSENKVDLSTVGDSLGSTIYYAQKDVVKAMAPRYEGKSVAKLFLYSLLSLLPFVTIFVYYSNVYNTFYFLGEYTVALCTSIGAIIISLINILYAKANTKIGDISKYILLGLALLVYGFTFVKIFDATFDTMAVAILVGIVTPFMLYLSSKVFSFSEQTSKRMGKCLGFKDYIYKVEYDKMKMLVDENPKYFYDILPYVYVLGYSNKFLQKFENIVVPLPEWYEGTNKDFVTPYFVATMLFNTTNVLNQNILNSQQFKSLTQSSSRVGGGGFGGGGSVGGGFGGGGGRGW